jgi:glycosyltransferase involved in cell wall biosynthesis
MRTNKVGVINRNFSVCFYRHSLYNRGGDRLIVEYANYLAAAGHRVAIYVNDMNSAFTVHPLVRVERIPWSGRAGTLLFGAVHKFEEDVIVVDIIHLLLLLSIRNRAVYYAQADDREYYSNFLLKKMIDLLYTVNFRFGSPIISMSQHLTDIFTNRYARLRAHTIETGIDHSIFYPEPDIHLVNAKAGKKAIVFMSRGDEYRKGYDVALKTFRTLDAIIGDKIEVWICGRQLDQCNFRFPIRNFGAVSDARMRQILSSSDIFFYPSRHEGFGLFPLEAMACGCISVTTDAIPYAKATKGVFAAPVEDVSSLARIIASLIQDEKLLQESRDLAVKASGEFDIEKSKVAFLSALTSIVSGKEQCA